MKECFTVVNKEIIDYFTKERIKAFGKGLGIFLGILGIMVTTIAALVVPAIWLLEQFDLSKPAYAIFGLAICLFYAVTAFYLIQVHTVCKRLRIEKELLKMYEGYTIKWVSTMGDCMAVTLHNYSYLEVMVRPYEERKVLTVYDGDL